MPERIAFKRGKACRDLTQRVFDTLLGCCAIPSAIRPDLVSHGAAKQFVHRHPERLAFDIPEGNLYAADSRHLDHSAANVVIEVIEPLPVLLNTMRVFADKS